MFNSEKKKKKKKDLKCEKSGRYMFSERCHGNIYYVNEKVVIDFDSKDTYLLFAMLVTFIFFFENQNRALNYLGL